MKRVTRYTSAGHTPVAHFFFNRSAGQGSVPALSPPGGLTPVRAEIFSLSFCPAPINRFCCVLGLGRAPLSSVLHSLRSQQLKKKSARPLTENPGLPTQTPKADRFIWILRTSRL